MVSDFPVRLMPKERVDRYALYLLSAVSLLHLLVSGRFGLSSDEAHYALYGSHLALSYFDHPPLVGWLQSLVLLFSDSDFALRLWPVFISLLSGWNLYRLVQELFPDKTPWLGFYSLVLLQTAAAFHLLAMAMVPETPLMLFALLFFRSYLKALESDRIIDWLWSGLWIGLAGLSKYTAIVLVVSAVLLLIHERKYSSLVNVGFWLALVLAAVIISPVLYWNYENNWISFAYQIHHGTGGSHWRADNFFTGLAGQFVANGPVIFIFGSIAVVHALRNKEQRGAIKLLLMALPLLILFNWNSGYVPALPHWTLLGWMLLVPLATLWLMERWQASGLQRFFVYGFGGLYLLIAVFVHSLLFFPWLPLSTSPEKTGQDWLTEFHGWDDAMVRAKKLRDKYTPGGNIFVGSWTLASRLAWYGRPEPIMVTDDRYDQFDIWFGSPSADAKGIFVQWSVAPFPPRQGGQAQGFSSCRDVDGMNIMLGDRIGAEFRFFACEGYRP